MRRRVQQHIAQGGTVFSPADYAATTEGVTWVVRGRPALYYRKVAGARVGAEMEVWIQKAGRPIVDEAVRDAARESITQ